MTGCGGDTAVTVPSGQSSHLYFQLALNQHAINMALNTANTIQLIATPFDINGDTLSGAGQPTFTVSDSCITVSSSGLATARYRTNPGGTRIIASLQNHDITFADTAFVRVIPTAPTAAIRSFSIQPVAGDSAIRPAGHGIFESDYSPTITARDADGNALSFDPFHSGNPDSPEFVWFATSNQTKAYYDRGSFPDHFVLQDTGHVTLYAQSWEYGVSVQDSLKFLVGWPLFFYNEINSYSDATNFTSIVIGVGGEIIFDRIGSLPWSFVFNDSTALDSVDDEVNIGEGYLGSGNIYFPAGTGFQTQSRIFPRAGTYHWYLKEEPTITGTIYVLTNPR